MKRYLAGLEALTKKVVSLLLPVMFSVDEINSMMRKEVQLTLEVNADDLDQSRKRVFPGIITGVSYKVNPNCSLEDLGFTENNEFEKFNCHYELVIEPHLSLASKEPRTLLYKDRKNVKEVIKGNFKGQISA